MQVVEKHKPTQSSLHSALRLIKRATLNPWSREELFQEICTIAVERGRFEEAWIGWIDAVTGHIGPVAAWSTRTGLLSSKGTCADYPPEGCGPAAIAIWSEKTYICNDLLDNPAIIPWRDHALRRGLRASASFPICENGVVVGVISLHSAIPGCFQQKEVELVEEAVADLFRAVAGEAVAAKADQKF